MTISLASKHAEVRKDIVDILEEALALAREGKIIDLVLGYTDTEAGFETRCSYEHYLKTVGLAEMLKQDVVNTGDHD